MAEIRICKRFTFEAGHHLPNHNGACRQSHGHSYKMEVGVAGPIDENITGMIADFKQLKDMVNLRVVEVLDHSYLNDLKMINGFPHKNPTAEMMILWIVAQIQEGLKTTPCNLAFVRLWETEGSWVEWVA